MLKMSRGAAEMGVRLLWLQFPAPPPSSSSQGSVIEWQKWKEEPQVELKSKNSFISLDIFEEEELK